MTKFVLLYKGPVTPTGASHEGWPEWFQGAGDKLLDMGSPRSMALSSTPTAPPPTRQSQQEELDQCKQAIRRQLAAHKELVILALDRYFVHRLRSVADKDSNPLNEVELLSGSLTNNEGVLRANNVIKYDPDESVVKLQVGDPIELTESAR